MTKGETIAGYLLPTGISYVACSELADKINAALAAARREAFEEAAKIAEAVYADSVFAVATSCGERISAAIRAKAKEVAEGKGKEG